MFRIQTNHGSIQQGRAGLFIFLFAILLGAGAYTAYYLKKIHEEKELEIQRLNQVVERLESDSRVAQVMVKTQGMNAKNNKKETTIKFVEISRNGSTLAPRYFTVEGDVVYFDALVIKFDREYVERGEALRGKSICLFRRIFGESQSPEQGFAIDENASGQGRIPDVYRINPDPTAFEVDLWNDFWRYATHPKEAKDKGVRIIQGEAVYQKLTRDNIYTLTLDSDGGLNIVAESVPGILRDEINASD
ncbi:MAG: hypothetical protein ABIK28_16330 [Planctomycetota bacterium]